MAKKEGIVLGQLRDYGHQVLAGRKERRRFSLISMRRFSGDYLLVGDGESAEGGMLRSAAGIGGELDRSLKMERGALRLILLLLSFVDVVGGEQVAFSARAQTLVSKLGRSSTRSPRYLVLVRSVFPSISSSVQRRANLGVSPQTEKAVYILITQAVNGRAQTTLERKIPLITIKSVGLSGLRDDWIVRFNFFSDSSSTR